MEHLIKEWDGESVITCFDKPSGAWIFIAIHSTRLGPAIGGTRMKPYADVQAALTDAMRLAGGMTHKWAAAGFDAGGGKAVLAVPADLDPQSRTDLLRRYGALVGKHNGLFLTGPDLGTTSEDMDVIGENAGPHVFGRTTAGGGAGNPAPFTALGVFTSIMITAGRLFGDSALDGKRVLIQGVGSVGRELIDLLKNNTGAEILISDVNAAEIRSREKTHGLQSVAPDDVYGTPCDIFAPCAVGGILNEETIPRLRCRAVVGAANNQLADPEDAERLRAREIIYAPDFITNSGGAIGIVGMETRGWSREQALDRVVQSIEENLSQVFDIAEKDGIDTDKAAKQLT
ncbi:MAG: leucine dehydrogenase, partial [Deltaproteobacteria bacterium]|nr:leucine dehydrogenase [Deltaproteobacteria bacterium]